MTTEHSSQQTAAADPTNHPLAARALIARLRRRAPVSGEAGFSLMEVVLAMTLFAIVATALLGVLVSSVNAQSLARQKTVAEQSATAAVEALRELSYSQVGNPGKNPNGNVVLNQTMANLLGSANVPPGTGNWSVTQKVEWNNDPNNKVATSYRNAAFYKKVTITVTRPDGKVLSQMVTYVADTGTSTGVTDAELDVSVLDLGNGNAISGQDVNLTTGPSAPLSDTTDGGGSIVFPALTANPTSGSTAYYNLSLTPLSGWTLLKDDDIAQTPASAQARWQLAPSEIEAPVLHLYHGSTITIALKKASDGSNYSGNATLTLGTTLRGVATTNTLSYTGSPKSTSTFAGEPILPTSAGAAYITGGYTASVANGFYATAVTKTTVPNDYTNGDYTSTFTLTGYPTGTLTATVTWAGQAVANCANCVTLTGGPTGVNLTASTNASGVATFTDLPEGNGYTLSATKGGQTGTASATVVAGATTNVPVLMPTGTVNVNVTWGGSPVANCANCVTISGGNLSATLTGSTDASGNITFPTVPAGTGYTVTATKSGQSASQSGVSVTGGGTTSVSLALPTGTVNVTVTWAGVPVANCTNCVTISGGNLTGTLTGSTNSSGVAVFPNVPAGSGYTVSATSGGQTGSTTGVSVTGGSTTNVTVLMPTGTVAVTVTSGGTGIQCTNCVTISGGNLSAAVSGSTNASGQVNFNTVPAGSGYTVSFTNAGASASQTGVSVTNGSTTNVALTIPTGTLTVTVTSGGNPVQCTSCVTVTGGNVTGTLTGTTNASGVVSFTVPAGTGYTVTATSGGVSASQSSVTVTGGATTNVSLALPAGSIQVTVTWAGLAVANCVNCVTLSGGGLSSTLTGSTNGAGVVTFTNIPATTGYTVTATKSGQSANQTGISVSSGATTNVSIALPVGTVAVTLTSGGYAIQCTNCVTISGGNLSASVTGSTNASGQVNFLNVPAGNGYTVDATYGGASGSTSSVNVTNGGTTNVSVTIASGTLKVTVTSGGTGVTCTNCVTVSGGGLGAAITGTTNASGVVNFTIPPGSGYTASVTTGGATASQSSITVTSGSTTNVPLTLPTGTIQVATTWAGLAVANCVNCVVLSGGNLSASVTASTDASGNTTFTNVPNGTGYTVTSTKNSQSANQTGISVSSGATTNVAIALPTGTVAVTVTWAGATVANCTNCVTLSGGNLSASVTGSTNASGQVNFTTVPTGTGYTVTAVKNGKTGSTSSVTVTNGATTNVSVAMPTQVLTVTIQRGGVAQASTSIKLSITGGPNGTAGAAPAWTITQTTNASGQMTITVPLGTGAFSFTVKAYLGTCSAFSSNKSGSNTVLDNVASTTVNMTSSTCPPTLP